MKKIIGCILTAAFLLQMAVMPVYASKKINADLDMMIAVLREIDVLPSSDEAFDNEAKVSRAQFSEYVGKMLKYTPQFSMQYFNDVPRELEQSGYINVLADMGIISFSENGYFEPDRTIRYAEACKMLLCAMGYGNYSLLRGAPMETYVSVAGERGVGISVKNPEEITAEETVRLIFNAMSESIMVTENKETKIDDGTNLFAKYHDVYFDKGRVDAAYGARLEQYKMPIRERVIVSGEDYITTLDLSGMLGQEIEYAYRYTDNEGTLFYAKIKDPDKTVTVSSSLVESFNESSYSFQYYVSEESTKTKRVSLEKNVQIILNGAPSSANFGTVIQSFIDKTRRGSVTFVDYDNNGRYETAIVKSYEPLPGSTIDTNNENIYGGFEKKTIHYSDYDIIRFIDERGREKDISEISSVVLNIAESENNEVLEIVVTNETSDISIGSVNQTDNKLTSSSGELYNVDKRVMEEYGSTLLSYGTIRVYFDMFGYIVKIETGVSDGYQLGYLINGRSWFEDSKDRYVVRFKVFTRDKKINDYYLTEKVKVDEVSYNLSKNLKGCIYSLPAVSTYGGEDSTESYRVAPQLIRFKLDANGEINAVDSTNVSANEDKDNSLVCRHKDAAMLYANRIGLDTYYSSSETAVFRVPVLNDDGKMNKNGAWSEPSVKDFGTEIGMTFDNTYTVSTYNYSDRSYYTDVIVMHQEQTDKTKSALVYTGKIETYDSEEDTALTAVKCVQGGNETQYTLSEGLEKQLEKQDFKYGDLFYVTLDGAGYVTTIKKIFDSETKTFIHSVNNDYWYYGEYSPYSNWSYRTGEDNRNEVSKMYVLKKRGDAVYGSYQYSDLKADQYQEIMKIGSIPVTVVDKDREKCEKGTFNSILSYEDVGENVSFILIESRLQSASSVIMYK
ncbi:MAG: S-layer homology domain-containing protein [Clostridia bacterium]|nr:S-layer homology domain-containing protein [Clostridia bacterium]